MFAFSLVPLKWQCLSHSGSLDSLFPILFLIYSGGNKHHISWHVGRGILQSQVHNFKQHKVLFLSLDWLNISSVAIKDHDEARNENHIAKNSTSAMAQVRSKSSCISMSKPCVA